MLDSASTKIGSPRRRLLRLTLDRLLRRAIGDRGLTVQYPDGTESHFGPPGDVTVAVRSWAAVRRLLLDPALTVGECYMDGSLVLISGTFYQFLDLLFDAIQRGRLGPAHDIRSLLSRLGKRLSQYNPAPRSRRNAAHHYDLDEAFYRLLLDEDMQYSCAFFRTGQETLSQAQAEKKRLIAKKLLLDRPGLRVLDIGCGWGGMALTLARDYGASVTGVTLSREQLAVARARAEAAGLDGRVRFELMDYRAIPLTFDRIVSVGMFEHVGVNHYRRFFEIVQRCLEPDGVALVHAIGRSHGPRATNSWLKKYIFPGGYSPALSEVIPAVEKSGLVVTDIEILRLHYAKTLACWRANLERNREAVLRLYDASFLRMFEFYLVGSELAFRRTGHMVWQMQLARRQDTVPLSRDYLTDASIAEHAA